MVGESDDLLVSSQVPFTTFKVTNLILQQCPHREGALGGQSQSAVAELPGGLPITPGAKEITKVDQGTCQKGPVVQPLCRGHRSHCVPPGSLTVLAQRSQREPYPMVSKTFSQGVIDLAGQLDRLHTLFQTLIPTEVGSGALGGVGQGLQL